MSISRGVLNGLQLGGCVIEKPDQGGVTVRRRRGEGCGKAVTGDVIYGETEIVCESKTVFKMTGEDGT